MDQLQSMSVEDISALKRDALFKLSKKYGVSGRGKNSDMIKGLLRVRENYAKQSPVTLKTSSTSAKRPPRKLLPKPQEAQPAQKSNDRTDDIPSNGTAITPQRDAPPAAPVAGPSQGATATPTRETSGPSSSSAGPHAQGALSRPQAPTHPWAVTPTQVVPYYPSNVRSARSSASTSQLYSHGQPIERSHKTTPLSSSQLNGPSTQVGSPFRHPLLNPETPLRDSVPPNTLSDPPTASPTPPNIASSSASRPPSPVQKPAEAAQQPPAAPASSSQQVLPEDTNPAPPREDRPAAPNGSREESGDLTVEIVPVRPPHGNKPAILRIVNDDLPSDLVDVIISAYEEMEGSPIVLRHDQPTPPPSPVAPVAPVAPEAPPPPESASASQSAPDSQAAPAPAPASPSVPCSASGRAPGPSAAPAPAPYAGPGKYPAREDDLRALVRDMADMARVQDARLAYFADLEREAGALRGRLETLAALVRQERGSVRRMRVYLECVNAQAPTAWREEDVWDKACRLRANEIDEVVEVETEDESDPEEVHEMVKWAYDPELLARVASGELPTSKRRRQDDDSEQPAKKARGEDTPFKPNGVAAMNVAPLAQPSLSGIMEEDEEE